MPTRTNGFVGIAEGNAPTNGTIENANLGASQQIVGRNPQDQTFTPHLYSPVKETVGDGCSCLNQRIGVSWRVFPEYTASHLQLAATHSPLKRGMRV